MYLLAVLFIFIPTLVYGETEVIVWDKQGSPYVLNETFQVEHNQKLIINPGVTVMSASTTPSEDPFTIFAFGDLEIKGAAAEPVRLIGLGGIFTGGNTLIQHGDLDGTGIVTSKSTTTITSSKIRNMPLAIEVTAGTLEITGSEIIDNEKGIYSRFFDPSPVLMLGGSAIGGMGNALGDDPEQNHITVRNSVLEGNGKYAIKNDSPNTVDATDNWWGTASGPGAAVAGSVISDPWKTADPRVKSGCCSNVLFLPGFEGSRLYREEKGLFGTSTNRLWEPNRNNDVRKLFMNSEGISIDPSIFTGEVMGSAFGIKNIYKSFIAMMDGVVAEKTINEWLPFAYDWRMSVEDVVLKTRLIEEVERLARSSRTGKVTVIAHSNGGLVARTLGKELEKRGKSGLVDKVILVAVPVLGTPSAISSMLHGDGQSILGGLVLKSGVARTLGINLPGAYGLLPTQEYFSKIMDPVLTFFGKTVGSYREYADFLTSGRMQPGEADLKSPALLSYNIFSNIEKMRSSIDTWKFPTATEVVSLVGWGVPTTKSIEYSTSSPRIHKSTEGDGTVLSGSAGAYAGNTLYYNQGLQKRDTNKDVTHADILESDSVKSILSTALSTTSLPVSNLPPYITSQKPNVKNYPWMSWITVSVHSPIEMDIYDSKGGHMGLVQLPDSDFQWFENTIGGPYDFIGDEKYYTLPGDDIYTVKLKGSGRGRFTFQVEKFMGDMDRISSIVYPELSVNPMLTGNTTVGMNLQPDFLRLDQDGNGITDVSSSPNTLKNQLSSMDAIKAMVLSFKLSRSVESSLVSRTESIRTYFRQQKTAAAIDGLRVLVDKLKGTHWTAKDLPEYERLTLIAMYGEVLKLAQIHQD